MSEHEARVFARFLLAAAVLFALVGLAAWAQRALADGALDRAAPAPGCAPILAWGRDLVAEPGAYLERWREVDDRRTGPPPGPAWSDGYYRMSGDAAAADGATFVWAPTRRSVFAVLREIHAVSDATPSEAAADEAIDALVGAARSHGLSLGPNERIPHAAALALFDEALATCLRDGTAPIPTLEEGPR